MDTHEPDLVEDGGLPPLIDRCGGYLARKIRDHPLANAQGYVLEHRRVVWEEVGPFDPSMHVHHINGDKHDNRKENLEVLSAGEHQSKHLHHDWQAIQTEYEAGATINSLASKHAVHGGNISKMLRQRGVQMRPRGRSGWTMAIEQRRKVAHPQANEFVRRYQAGEPMEAIAAAYGVYASTVSRALRREGVAVRPVGRPRV